MTPTPRTRLAPSVVAWAFIALALIYSAPVHAQDQAFKDGMKAVDEEKWADAARLMQKAVEENAQDSTRKVEYGGIAVLRVGRKSVDYLPNYYLGQARFMMQPQDCAGAINAWSRSENQGAVKARREFLTDIQGGYAECEKKGVLPPARFAPLFASTERAYNEVNSITRGVSALGQQNQEQWRPEMRETFDKVTAELETASRRLASAAQARSQNDFAESAAATERARVLIVRLEAALHAAIDGARSAGNLGREVEQLLAAAEADDRQIDARVSGGRGTGLTPALGAVRQQGRDALSRAQGLYGTGSKSSNVGQLTESRTLARDASAKFKQVVEDLTKIELVNLRQRITEARTGAAQEMRLYDDLFLTLDRRMAANPALAAELVGEYEAARKQGETARRRLEVATGGEDLAAIRQRTRDTSTVRQRLGELTARFGPLTLKERGLTPALEEGSASYLAGRYEEALRGLDPPGGFAADDPMRLHVHLFRAASLHALYMKSGGTNTDLRTRALAEIEECRKLDSTFQPDRRFFSRAFVAFFEGRGTATGQDVATARP